MNISVERTGDLGAVQSVTVRVSGRFGFKTGCDIWEACQPELRGYRIYYLDLARTTVLHDNGIAWLRMFLGWARNAGRSVRIRNATPQMRIELAKAGVSITGTAQQGDAGLRPRGDSAPAVLPVAQTPSRSAEV